MYNSDYRTMYKVSLNVAPSTTNITLQQVFESLVSLAHEYVSDVLNCNISVYQFTDHCFMEMDNRHSLLRTGSMKDGTDGGMNVWSMFLRIPDPDIARRSWTTNMCIQFTETEDTVLFQYIESYRDYGVGYVKKLSSPPQIVPPFILEVLDSNDYQCFAGDFPVPTCAASLGTRNSRSIANFIRSSGRVLPVIVIACPHLINPNGMAELVVGNAAVYFVSDAEQRACFNQFLQPDGYIEENAVAFFNPIYKGVTHLPYFTTPEEDVIRIGADAVFTAHHRACCQDMRGHERRAFVTCDDISNRRNVLKLSEIEQENAQLKQKLICAENELSGNRQSLSNALEKLAAAEQNTDAYLLEELIRHEKNISEYKDSIASIKRQLVELTTFLYDNNQRENSTIFSSHPACVELAHLRDALLYASEAIGKDKGRRKS